MKQRFFRYPPVLRVTLIGLTVLCCSVLISCEIEHTKIPDCAVYLRRDIYNEGLLPPSSFLYVTSRKIEIERLGYGGIVVVHRDDPQEPYCAFDLACPNCVSPSIRVGEPDSMTLVCACPECGENYDLFFGLGTPINGISKVGMKKYSAYLDPGNDRYVIVEP